MKNFVFCIACVILNPISSADEPKAETVRPATVVREFIAKITELQRGFDAALQRDRDAYRDRFDQLKDELTGKLKLILDARTKAGDLDGALDVRTKIEEFEELTNDPPGGDPARLAAEVRSLKRKLANCKPSEKDQASQKPKSVAKYDFLGSNRQRINSFVFMSDGTVDSHHDYDKASWSDLPDGYILFRYGPGSAYIVFQPESETLLRGFASSHGKLRHLRKIP